MKVTAIKTPKIIPGKKQSLHDVIRKVAKKIPEKSVLVITSKIVSICEGNYVSADKDRHKLAEENAEYYIPVSKSKYNSTLTIKNHLIVASAGIDKSNSQDYLVLWPENPQKSANDIRRYIKKEYGVKKVGVIITDSRGMPLRRGTTGASISYSGFRPLKDYRGKKDIFGHELHLSVANIADALAASAVAVMGEGKEQTPIALLEDLDFVDFVARNPTKAELTEFNVPFKDDLYSSIIFAGPWSKGGKNRK